MKEHEAIQNPTILFRGLTALNGSVTSASMNATLLNTGFCEDDKSDQTHNQEDMRMNMRILKEPLVQKSRYIHWNLSN